MKKLKINILKKIFGKVNKKENDDSPRFVNVPYYFINKHPEKEKLYNILKNSLEEFEKTEKDFSSNHVIDSIKLFRSIKKKRRFRKYLFLELMKNFNKKYQTSELKPFDPESAKLQDNFVNEHGDVYTLCDNSVYCFVVRKNDNSKNIYASHMTREMAKKKLFVIPENLKVELKNE